MEQLIGTIQLFAFNYPTYGWMLCDGRLLEIKNYGPLFALIGKKYGGDGVKTFAIPNLKNANFRTDTFANWYIATEGYFPYIQQ